MEHKEVVLYLELPRGNVDDAICGLYFVKELTTPSVMTIVKRSDVVLEVKAVVKGKRSGS